MYILTRKFLKKTPKIDSWILATQMLFFGYKLFCSLNAKVLILSS